VVNRIHTKYNIVFVFFLQRLQRSVNKIHPGILFG
jgi:hypothetical protein